jgi:hypothetical protein
MSTFYARRVDDALCFPQQLGLVLSFSQTEALDEADVRRTAAESAGINSRHSDI